MAREKARFFSFLDNGKVAFVKHVISTSFNGTLMLATYSISASHRQVGISGPAENASKQRMHPES